MSDTVKAKVVATAKPHKRPKMWAVIARKGKRYRVFGMYEFRLNADSSIKEVAALHNVEESTIRIIEIPGDAP